MACSNRGKDHLHIIIAIIPRVMEIISQIKGRSGTVVMVTNVTTRMIAVEAQIGQIISGPNIDHFLYS